MFRVKVRVKVRARVRVRVVLTVEEFLHFHSFHFVRVFGVSFPLVLFPVAFYLPFVAAQSSCQHTRLCWRECKIPSRRKKEPMERTHRTHGRSGSVSARTPRQLETPFHTPPGFCKAILQHSIYLCFFLFLKSVKKKQLIVFFHILIQIIILVSFFYDCY
jgi:hypothetical protein